MKFTSSKKISDHAYRIHEISQERAELMERLEINARSTGMMRNDQ